MAEGDGSAAIDSSAGQAGAEEADSLANDPHNREYYLAQIPFTEEQLEASNMLIQEGLFHSGIIFKDKLDNLTLSEKTLGRLLTQYPDYEHNDEALYHLFLLYSRQERQELADSAVARLQSNYPESQWTILLSDPNFAENQRFGVHIEDSIYAATYDAFKGDRYDEVRANAQVSESRFPLGAHRPKFLFVEGLTRLNQGDAKGCTERMQQVVDKYPQSEVSELAGMIIKGVQQGRRLHGGKFDMGDVWSRRASDMADDSTRTDTLRFERDTRYVFMLAYEPDSVNQNQLLFEMAKHNFSNYLVRNFDIVTDQDANGLCRMLISGFLSYDEARQYARQLHAVEGRLATLLHACRHLIVSEDNLRLLGTSYSYHDYELFFEKQIEPVEISTRPLLEEPEVIIQQEEDGEEPATEGQTPQADDDMPDDPIFNNGPVQQQNDFPDFDEDFWR
jgi:TolA-binding protein